MTAYMITFLVMLAVFMLGCFLLKFPVSVSMMLAAISGGIVSGNLGGLLRHLVEGEFSYIDTILTIATAMIFMKVIEESGALDALSSLIIEKFHKVPAVLLILIMLVVMFPGMITGSSTAAVLSAGSIMAPVLILMGVDKINTASIIAMGGMLGMIAPPVNLPAMIIGGGIDVPYAGFTGPLLLLTLPLAVVFVLMLGYKQARHIDYNVLKPALVKQDAVRKQYGLRIYLPLFVLIALMLVTKVFRLVDDLGMPVCFLISAAVGLFTGKKIKPVAVVLDAVRTASPVMGILMGVGMFIQVMTLSGVRGFIVVTCLSLPTSLLLLAAAISIPLFGSVSAFGAASVLGVPFALAFLSGDTVVTIAGLSLIASLGDMMPPTALAGLFAAQVSGVEKYSQVLKRCIVPSLILLVYACVIINYSKVVAGWF